MMGMSMRCLVIDDDESPRLLMTALLKRTGHLARAVANGVVALAMLEADTFDIAIVDMELPGPDGAATIAELRKKQPALKILVVSGHDDRGHVLAALEAGADGYLLKDDTSELLATALGDIEAGFTVLSPRIHASEVRQLLRALGRPVVEARVEPRSRGDSVPGENPG